jgi:hypothetical protein
MINLYDASNNVRLCEISEEQLKYFQDEMEEEFLEDQDYSITGLELDYYDGQVAEAKEPTRAVSGLEQLLKLLRQALGDKEELIIRWVRE